MTPIAGAYFVQTFPDIFAEMAAREDAFTTESVFQRINEYLGGNWAVRDAEGNTPLLAIGKLYTATGNANYRKLLIYLLGRLMTRQPPGASIATKHYSGLSGVNSRGDNPILYLSERDLMGDSLMSVLHREESDVIEEVCDIVGDVEGCGSAAAADLAAAAVGPLEPPIEDMEVKRARSVLMDAWEVRVQKAVDQIYMTQGLLKEANKKAMAAADAAVRAKKVKGVAVPSLEKALTFATRQAAAAAVAADAAVIAAEKVKAEANEAVGRIGGEFTFKA